MYEYDAYIQAVSWLNLIANTLFLLGYSRYIKFRILDPATWYVLFHFMLFAIRPTFVFELGYRANFMYMGFSPDLPDVIITFAVANLGLLAFLLGASIFPRPRFDYHTPLHPTALERQTFGIAVAISLPLILFSIYYSYTHPLVEITARSGGNLIIDPDTGKKLFTSGSGYAYVFQNALPGVLIALMLLRRPQWWIFLIAISFMFQVFLTGRGRFVIIYFVLSLIIFAFQMRRISVAKRASLLLGFGGAAIILIAVGGVYRRVSRSLGGVSWQDLTLSDYFARTPLGDSQEFGMFEYLTYLVKYFPDSNYGFSYFTQYLEIFTQPIPRALWHGKPVGSPIKLIDLNEFGNFDGLTQSLPGAGWISLGLVGLLTLPSASGVVFSLFYRYAAKNWNKVDVRSLYIVALPFSVQWFRDGAPSIVQFYVFGMFPLIFWLALNFLARSNLLPKTPAAASTIHSEQKLSKAR